MSGKFIVVHKRDPFSYIDKQAHPKETVYINRPPLPEHESFFTKYETVVICSHGWGTKWDWFVENFHRVFVYCDDDELPVHITDGLLRYHKNVQVVEEIT